MLHPGSALRAEALASIWRMRSRVTEKRMRSTRPPPGVNPYRCRADAAPERPTELRCGEAPGDNATIGCHLAFQRVIVVRSPRRLMVADDLFPHLPVDAPKARSRASSTRFGDALARDDQFAVGPRPMRRPCGDVRISGAPKKPMGLSCAVARFLGGEAARRGCPLQAGSDGSVDHAFFDLRCLMNARHCLSRVIHSLPG
jgi:hypothetical protein